MDRQTDRRMNEQTDERVYKLNKTLLYSFSVRIFNTDSNDLTKPQREWALECTQQAIVVHFVVCIIFSLHPFGKYGKKVSKIVYRYSLKNIA